MTKQLYIQHGGVPMLIAVIGQFVMKVAMDVVIGIKKGLQNTFYVYPEGGYLEFNDYFVGMMWKYLYWCLKSCVYLMIFCFGGPILILIGIIFMYKHLFKRMGERSDYEEEKAAENAEGEGGGENAAME